MLFLTFKHQHSLNNTLFALVPPIYICKTLNWVAVMVLRVRMADVMT